jgi:hypothetical protein
LPEQISKKTARRFARVRTGDFYSGPDVNKGPTANAIRATRARLTPITLRWLREDLFRLELSLLEQKVENGVDLTVVAVLANTSKVLETIDQLQTGTRER